MKLLLILAVFIVGCDSPEPPRDTTEKIQYENNAYNSIDNWDYVIHFAYSGHKYIKFGRGNVQWGVHDPDCLCPTTKGH
jgi:hypothetical protein